MGKTKPGKIPPRPSDPLYLCPFPGCGGRFRKEPGKPECCLKHRQMIQDVAFILQHLKPPPVDASDHKGPKILVPKSGQSGQAIREAILAKGGKIE